MIAARSLALAALACCVLAGGRTGGAGLALAASATSGFPTWQDAQPVTAKDGTAVVLSAVSCAAPGDCGAGGQGASAGEAYVANEVNGIWGPARLVTRAGDGSSVDAISCAAPSNCSAGGMSDSDGPFVVSEVNGAWGPAEPVPGLAALDVGESATLGIVSCEAPGDCAAGGQYESDLYGDTQAFVVTEVNGTWGTAQEVPGTGALNGGGYAAVDSLSCPPASTDACTAVGFYTTADDYAQPFITDQGAGGAWSTALAVPGLADLSDYATMTGVSCPAAGDCTAVGAYSDYQDSFESDDGAFTVTESGGTWQDASALPGILPPDQGGDAEADQVSCSSPGDCATAGFTYDGDYQVYVASESGGTWQGAVEVPGLTALSTGGADLGSLSCGGDGDCVVAGDYYTGAGLSQAFVATETSGTWGTAQQVPGTEYLNTEQEGGVNAVSCPAAAYCAAVGLDTGANGPAVHHDLGRPAALGDLHQPVRARRQLRCRAIGDSDGDGRPGTGRHRDPDRERDRQGRAGRAVQCRAVGWAGDLPGHGGRVPARDRHRDRDLHR